MMNNGSYTKVSANSSTTFGKNRVRKAADAIVAAVETLGSVTGVSPSSSEKKEERGARLLDGTTHPTYGTCGQ